MTYSIDIINLCFLFLKEQHGLQSKPVKLHNNIKKKVISNTLEISISTINQWVYKYNYYSPFRVYMFSKRTII